MNLLAGTLYDPAGAVTKNTTAAIAMTALDTTNLRLRFTVPPSGRVRVRMMGVIHGATTFPSILMGVMDGATVKGRVAPVQSLGNTAVATALVNVEADFLVTGLTPGTDTNWDAAYGVETLVAATGIKYGGANDNVANNAFGGFAFELWDPSPEYTPAANGVPPTTATRTALDVVDDFLDTEVADIQARLPAALVSGRIDASVGAMAANVLTATAIAADAIGASELATDAVAEIVAALWNELTATARTAGSYGQSLKDNLTGNAFTRLGAPVGASISADLAAVQADTDNLQTRIPAALVSGRMSSIAEVISVDAIDAVALKGDAANEIADALLDRAAAVEGLTPRELLRLMAAVLLGKASGLETTTAIYRNLADTKDRVTATVDDDGNRTAVSRDAT